MVSGGFGSSSHSRSADPSGRSVAQRRRQIDVHASVGGTRTGKPAEGLQPLQLARPIEPDAHRVHPVDAVAAHAQRRQRALLDGDEPGGGGGRQDVAPGVVRGDELRLHRHQLLAGAGARSPRSACSNAVGKALARRGEPGGASDRDTVQSLIASPKTPAINSRACARRSPVELKASDHGTTE